MVPPSEPARSGHEPASVAGRTDHAATIVAAARVAIFVTDAFGRVTEANPAARRLLGRPADARSPLALASGGRPPWCEVDTPGDWQGEIAFTGPDGEIVRLHVLATRVTGHGAAEYVCVGRGPVISPGDDGRDRQTRTDAHLTTLAALGRELTAATDLPDLLARLVEQLTSLADFCFVILPATDARARVSTAAHRDPTLAAALREAVERFPPEQEAGSPEMRALTTGRSVRVPVAGRTTGAEAPTVRLPDRFHPATLLVVPLSTRDGTIGVLTLGRTAQSRDFAAADEELARAAAHLAALAIDNALLLDDARRARARERQQSDRLAALAQASRAFAEASLTYPEVLTVVARRITAIAGDGCILRLQTGGDERLDAVAVEHLDPEAAALTRQILGIEDGADRLPGHVMRAGEPLMVNTSGPAELAARVSPAFAVYVERYGVHALLVLPLIVRGRAIGTLAVSRERDRPPFDEDDRLFLGDLAGRAALAIDNALRYRAEAAARSAAEAASRAKDEFLSVLSHELRTPLTPILLWTRLLERRPPDAATLTEGLAAIERAARAQAALVSDLLDVSRLITGRMRLDPRPLDLVAPMRRAIEAVAQAAEAKGVALHDRLVPGLIVVGDSERLQQVAWNLLSNAVRFTPTGGAVSIALDRDGSSACITVHDTGIGIEPSFLPHVFDRFRQADLSSTRAFGGLGLGLALVRHLVELHGGSVEAASDGPGHGATFTVRLPLLDTRGSHATGRTDHEARASAT